MKDPKQKTIPIKKWFDIVNVIFEKHTIPSIEDINKHCDQYLINMLLSCDSQFAGIAHEMSKLKISNKMYFDCLYNGIPKCKKFIKWNSEKEKKEKSIVYLMKYFGCSALTAKQYIHIISNDEIKYITEYYEQRGIIK